MESDYIAISEWHRAHGSGLKGGKLWAVIPHMGIDQKILKNHKY
jgi:hypothetical protein